MTNDALSNIDYADFVGALVKPADQIIESLSCNKMDALHMAVGISGESGELLDAIKKWVIYNKPLDRTNVIEELGDLEFYIEGLRQATCVTREECISRNKEKLSVRYKGIKYTDQAAQDRADKQNEGQQIVMSP